MYNESFIRKIADHILPPQTIHQRVSYLLEVILGTLQKMEPSYRIAFLRKAKKVWPPEIIRQKEACPLEILLGTLQAMGPSYQTAFLDKAEQAYEKLSLENVGHVTALGDICHAIQQLPTSTILSWQLEVDEFQFSKINDWTRIYSGDLNNIAVAIKVFPFSGKGGESERVIWQQIPVWKRLSHPNILPFHGICMVDNYLSLVYDWGENNDITGSINSSKASRPSVLLDVARGLQYLHSLDLPHGDLRPENIVIDKQGRALLTGYGLHNVYSNSDNILTRFEGCRWVTPEVAYTTYRMAETKEGDVFKFGMVAVKILTGRVPFHELNGYDVGLHIINGYTPTIPDDAEKIGIPDGMWEILESCWEKDPKARPSIEAVADRLQGFVGVVPGLDGRSSPSLEPILSTEMMDE